jgi:hypothetical protein
MESISALSLSLRQLVRQLVPFDSSPIIAFHSVDSEHNGMLLILVAYLSEIIQKN